MELTRRGVRIATGVTLFGVLLVVLSFLDTAVQIPFVDAGTLIVGAAIGIVGALALVVGRPTARQRLAARREDERDDR